ncbi:hypothetical protein BLOT_012428 [Blomia tropicalis]|nr:hypothetical protein BLOT_012428 [Blomia tropicalis]
MWSFNSMTNLTESIETDSPKLSDYSGATNVIINEPKRVHFVRNTPVFSRRPQIEIVVPKQTFYRLVCCQLYWSLINAAQSVSRSARKKLKRMHTDDGWTSADYMVYRMDIVTPYNIVFLIQHLEHLAIVEQNNLDNCSKQSPPQTEEITPQSSKKNGDKKEKKKKKKSVTTIVINGLANQMKPSSSNEASFTTIESDETDIDLMFALERAKMALTFQGGSSQIEAPMSDTLEDLVTFYRKLKQEKVNKKEVVNNDHCVCDSNGYQNVIINEPKRVHFAKNLPVYNRPIIVPEQTFYRLVCCQLYWSLINAAQSVYRSARKQLKRIRWHFSKTKQANFNNSVNEV